jgi:hypothetical protein
LTAASSASLNKSSRVAFRSRLRTAASICALDMFDHQPLLARAQPAPANVAEEAKSSPARALSELRSLSPYSKASPSRRQQRPEYLVDVACRTLDARRALHARRQLPSVCRTTGLQLRGHVSCTVRVRKPPVFVSIRRVASAFSRRARRFCQVDIRRSEDNLSRFALRGATFRQPRLSRILEGRADC